MDLSRPDDRKSPTNVRFVELILNSLTLSYTVSMNRTGMVLEFSREDHKISDFSKSGR